MNLEVLQESAQGFKAVKGLVFIGEPSPSTPIVTYQRDQETDFFPGYIELPGGNTDEFDPDVFMAFQREFDEEFGMLVMRHQVLCAQIHEGQPKPTDRLKLPSLLLAATIDISETTHFQPGDEGTHHAAKPLLWFLSRAKTIPAQKTRVKQLCRDLGLLDGLET